jgi:transcriptional regulator with XRE-family HTH domain
MYKSSMIVVNDHLGIMSAAQSRAARGWLGWSQRKLAEEAKVALRTVAAFERGTQSPRPNNISAMQRAVETAGVRLLFDDRGDAAGVARGDTDGELTRSRPKSRR